MYPMGADILKATPEKTGTSHSLPRFGMMASESVEDLSHMCLGGDRAWSQMEVCDCNQSQDRSWRPC